MALLFRIFSVFLICSFIVTSFYFPQNSYAAQNLLGLPEPGTMVGLSQAYVPMLIKGLRVHPDNPLLFDFIVDTGHSGINTDGKALRAESEKLIKYFLATLAIPEKDLWVNLSPYEKDRIVPEALGQTEMGREMLAQDYMLKQITASLIYPEKEVGKKFWDKVYAQAQQEFGTTEIPVNTFNKVWILPDQASVFVRNNTAYVVKAHLKVMLEEDYLATQKHLSARGGSASGGKVMLEEDYLAMDKHGVIARSSKGDVAIINKNNFNNEIASLLARNDTHTVASKIVREIVLPALEQEVNEGKNFASLRQVFHSLVLASWYKKNIKQAFLNQVYSNKAKIGGVDLADKNVKEKIYQQYLAAYKKGVFNYIKEDINRLSKQPMPRKYFSGGEKWAGTVATNPAVLATASQAQLSSEFPEFIVNAKANLAMTAPALAQAREKLTYLLGEYTANRIASWNTMNSRDVRHENLQAATYRYHALEGLIAKIQRLLKSESLADATIEKINAVHKEYLKRNRNWGKLFSREKELLQADGAMTASEITHKLEGLEKQYTAAQALNAEDKDTAYTEILMNIAELIQQHAAVDPHNSALKDRLTSLWSEMGNDQEMKGRVDALKTLVAAEGITADWMKAANVVFKDRKPVINDLPVAKWDPYKAEIWAPYLNGHIKELIEKTHLNLDANRQIVEPANGKIGRFTLQALKGLKELNGKTDHLDRLNVLVSLENDVQKNPDLGLEKADELKWGEIKNEDDFRLFMEEFVEAMRFMKWVENWEAKKDKISITEKNRYIAAKQNLELGAVLSDEEFILRVLSRNIPLSMLELVVNVHMKKGTDYRSEGQRLVDNGFARMVSLAGGSAARWRDSLATLIKRGIINAKHTPEGFIRQLAAYWLGNQEDGGETGVSLFLNNLQVRLQRGVKSAATFLVSPFTWDQIQGAKAEYFKDSTEKPDIDVILQNSGSAQRIEGAQVTDEDIPGKVLGHGNIRGWIPSIINALKQGAVIDIWRSGDSPFMQLDLPQTQEIIGRMAKDGLMHVALGNLRNIGQKGGGLVNQDGIPNVIDTLIPKTSKMVMDPVIGKEVEFVADRDITVFSAFTNFINNAGLLYAVSSEEDGLLIWQDVLDITRGDQQKLQALQAKLNHLTPKQIAKFSRNLVDLMPSEFVKKDEKVNGKKVDFVQWEQISGMLHGALPQAVKARQLQEKISDERALNLAYVDISLSEYNTLYSGPDAVPGEYVPGFVEVKGVGHLYGQLSSVKRIYELLVKRGVFSANDNIALKASAAMTGEEFSRYAIKHNADKSLREKVWVIIYKTNSKEKSKQVLFVSQVGGAMTFQVVGNTDAPRTEQFTTPFTTITSIEPASAAMTTIKLNEKDLAVVVNNVTPGGIDLNTAGMKTDVGGETIKMNFDPAMMQRFRSGDFTGIRIQILGVTRLLSVLPLFGMVAPRKEDEYGKERLAKLS